MNMNKSQIKPNNSPIPTSRKPITSKNPFSGGKNQEREGFVKVKNMVNIENKIKKHSDFSNH